MESEPNDMKRMAAYESRWMRLTLSFVAIVAVMFLTLAIFQRATGSTAVVGSVVMLVGSCIAAASLWAFVPGLP